MRLHSRSCFYLFDQCSLPRFAEKCSSLFREGRTLNVPRFTSPAFQVGFEVGTQVCFRSGSISVSFLFSRDPRGLWNHRGSQQNVRVALSRDGLQCPNWHGPNKQTKRFAGFRDHPGGGEVLEHVTFWNFDAHDSSNSPWLLATILPEIWNVGGHSSRGALFGCTLCKSASKQID